MLKRGLKLGDRVAAFGHNSDAYLLLYLGCAKAGLVHVPVNFNARHDELVYLLTQSEPRQAFIDPSLADHVDGVADRLGTMLLGTLHGGGASGASDDVLLSTSGTTSQAKGAMLTRRALVHEYVSGTSSPSCRRTRRASCSSVSCARRSAAAPAPSGQATVPGRPEGDLIRRETAALGPSRNARTPSCPSSPLAREADARCDNR